MLLTGAKNFPTTNTQIVIFSLLVCRTLAIPENEVISTSYFALVSYAVVFCFVTQRSLPQTAPSNRITFFSLHLANPMFASMMCAKFIVWWLLQLQFFLYRCPTWLTKRIKTALGSYRSRTRRICDAAGSNFSRSLFPCFPFSFLILVTSSLGNLKLTFLNNNVIRSPVLTKNFRASAVPQVSLTRVKEELFCLTGSVTLWQ